MIEAKKGEDRSWKGKITKGFGWFRGTEKIQKRRWYIV